MWLANSRAFSHIGSLLRLLGTLFAGAYLQGAFDPLGYWIIGAKGFLINSQCLPKQLFSAQAVAIRIELPSKVIQALSGLGMIGSERIFLNGQRPPKQQLRA